MYLERFDLTGRTAVVTGGSQGIGRACAEALGEAGARLVLVSRDTEQLQRTRSELAATGLDVAAYEVEVTDSAAVDRVAAGIAADHGGADILVASAGIARSGTAAEEVDDELYREVMSINLDGVFWCCRAFGRQMLAKGKGSIVTIGSISGEIVNTPQNQSYYNASKAAVHHLSRSLAAEWAARGVRVNSVAPGYIRTQMTLFGIEENPQLGAEWLERTPMKRLGDPDEIAATVLFLASDAASWLTGSIIVADGGYVLW